GEGRATLERSRELYSIIQFGLVDTWAAVSSGTFALSENYLYTREALAGYLDRLKPDGILSLTRWEPESDRLLSVATAALARLQLTPPGDHILILEKDAGSRYPLITVLIRKTPWSAAERQRAGVQAASAGYQVNPYAAPRSPAASDD